jgi:tRNA threonylcarbamoyladenosine biosynthesis protein TsaE
MKKTITNSEKETFELGVNFAKDLEKGSVVALTGELGAGKTVFVKGIAKGLDIKEHILSPTFTLLRQYKGLNHFDVYRIEDVEELSEIGFLEYLNGNDITIIEWANLIYDILPDGIIYVDIKRIDKLDKREIIISLSEVHA